jgi:glycosyltransferase involved in cell wall biosynthesis
MIERVPLITAAVTVYNAEDTVKKAIMSVVSQTWPNIEILIVDDASTDNSVNIIRRLQREYGNFRLFIHTDNAGVAVSRNTALKNAKGEFVVFFDDDDESSPDRITSQFQRLIDYESHYADGAPVICHTARKLLYPMGEIRIDPTMGQEKGVAPSGIAVAKRILLGTPLKNGYGSCPTCSQMARLSTYHLLGGFDPSFRRSEDTDLNIRLALIGGHFVGIRLPLVTQTMTKTVEKSIKDEYRYARLLLEKHKGVVENEGLYEFSCEWLKVKLAWFEANYLDCMGGLMKLMYSHPFLVVQRLYLALPNIRVNQAFRRFHSARIKMKKS